MKIPYANRLGAKDPILNWDKLVEIAATMGVNADRLTDSYNYKIALLTKVKEPKEVEALEKIVNPVVTSGDDKGVADWLKKGVSDAKKGTFDYMNSVNIHEKKEQEKAQKSYSPDKKEGKLSESNKSSEGIFEEYLSQGKSALNKIYETPEVKKTADSVKAWLEGTKQKTEQKFNEFAYQKQKQSQRLVNALTGTYPSLVQFVETFEGIKQEGVLPLVISNSMHLSLTDEVYKAFVGYLSK